MGTVIDDGLNTSYFGVTTYKRSGTDKWGDGYSTLIEGDTIEKILDLIFSVCGPAGCGESMAQSDRHVFEWQNIGPKVCDLFEIRNKCNEEEGS